MTVGRACEQIVRKKMVGFSDEITLICQPQYLYAFFPNIEEINKTNDQLSIFDYWKGRRESGLVKIQLEELERLITLFETADGETVLPYHPEASRLPTAKFKELADENLRFLHAIKGFIESSGKPYSTSNVHPTYGSMYGLPWSVRRNNQ